MYKHKCKFCGEKLIKRGRDKNGKQIYFCKHCNKKQIIRRVDLKAHAAILKIKNWLLNTGSLKQSGISYWTMRRWIIRYLKYLPEFNFKKEQSKIIVMDGLKIGKVYYLIAVSEKDCIGYIKCKAENFTNWSELLCKIPAPLFLICDGQKGMEKAVLTIWGDTVIIQRCIIHIFRFVIQHISRTPKLEQTKKLLELVKYLCKVDTCDKATIWTDRFLDWIKSNKEFLKQRSYSEDKKKWWYTHKKLRQAYKHVLNVLLDGKLFMYLKHNLPKTSNYIEAEFNSPIKKKIHCHDSTCQNTKELLTEFYLLIRSTNCPKWLN